MPASEDIAMARAYTEHGNAEFDAALSARGDLDQRLARLRTDLRALGRHRLLVLPKWWPHV